MPSAKSRKYQILGIGIYFFRTSLVDHQWLKNKFLSEKVLFQCWSGWSSRWWRYSQWYRYVRRNSLWKVLIFWNNISNLQFLNKILRREELRRYDPNLYNLILEVFPCANHIIDRCSGKQLDFSSIRKDCDKNGRPNPTSRPHSTPRPKPTPTPTNFPRLSIKIGGIRIRQPRFVCALLSLAKINITPQNK